LYGHCLHQYGSWCRQKFCHPIYHYVLRIYISLTFFFFSHSYIIVTQRREMLMMYVHNQNDIFQNYFNLNLWYFHNFIILCSLWYFNSFMWVKNVKSLIWSLKARYFTINIVCSENHGLLIHHCLTLTDLLLLCILKFF
jgi:hypothetical protein